MVWGRSLGRISPTFQCKYKFQSYISVVLIFLQVHFALSVTTEKWSALDGHFSCIDLKNIQKTRVLLDLLNGGMSTSLDSSPQSNINTFPLFLGKSSGTETNVMALGDQIRTLKMKMKTKSESVEPSSASLARVALGARNLFSTCATQSVPSIFGSRLNCQLAYFLSCRTNPWQVFLLSSRSYIAGHNISTSKLQLISFQFFLPLTSKSIPPNQWPQGLTKQA